jgi:hypothetical protein
MIETAHARPGQFEDLVQRGGSEPFLEEQTQGRLQDGLLSGPRSTGADSRFHVPILAFDKSVWLEDSSKKNILDISSTSGAPMESSRISPQRVFEVLEAFRRTAALKTAIELDLFHCNRSERRYDIRHRQAMFRIGTWDTKAVRLPDLTRSRREKIRPLRLVP